MTETELCGAWGGCTLPAGHNMGKPDVPSAHQLPEHDPYCRYQNEVVRTPVTCDCGVLAKAREEIAKSIEAQHGGVMCYHAPDTKHGYVVCTHAQDAAIARGTS